MKQRTCISLFSGGGGLDLGLEASGFTTLLATDIDQHSCISLKNNSEESKRLNKPFLSNATILCEDVQRLSGSEILELANVERGKLSLLSGGPPCQAFSVFGRRKGRNDPRGMLVYHYLRLLEEVDPEAFVFENVYGLLTIEGGAIFEELIHRLSAPSPHQKYELSVHRLDASNFGVPQFRDRIFIIGSKSGAKVEKIPQVCNSSADLFGSHGDWRNVGDAFRGLPPMGTPGWHNHTGRNHSQRIIDRYRGMKPRERDSKTRINKLDLDSPSFTIIVGSDAGGGKGHIHPIHPREVTPRESARIQTFPDWWWFSGTSRHPIRQVGNAVPPLLGAAVGSSILREIFGDNEPEFEEVLDLLDQQHLFARPKYLDTPASSDHHVRQSTRHLPTEAQSLCL